LGEDYRLSPLPLDSTGQPVHGLAFLWTSSDAAVCAVASDGTATAKGIGQCTVTAIIGNTRASVLIEVRSGARQRLTNAQWDSEHMNDCLDAEKNPDEQSRVEAAGKSSHDVQVSQPPDPDEQPNVAAAGSRLNAVGHPRFSPNLLENNASSTDNQLGSASYNLNIPIFESDGRGVGVNLSLVYNSRMWTKDPATNKMVWDYDIGWPAPGFRLNYGHIVPDYDVPFGDLGNYLLVEADGTRTPLINQGGNLYRSADGRYIEYRANSNPNRLFLPDGTRIRYQTPNGSKLLPVWIKDVHGNSIDIAYVFNCQDALRVEPCACGTNCSRPPRQAIKQITDTLGRFVTFHYYANGHLAEVHAPGHNGGADRVVAKFYYQTIALSHNFSLSVAGTPAGGQVDVLRRVFFPETGRGYVFGSYSSYGMCTRVSTRLGMTDASEGTETAFSEYAFQTSGQLSDSPEFTQRSDWWQGRTDDSGVPTSAPAIYTYSRTSNSLTMTNKVTGPVGPDSTTTVMISNNSSTSQQYGLLSEQRLEIGANVKAKAEFTYTNPASGSLSSGLQRSRVKTTDDGSPANQTQVDHNYGSYGRLVNTIEYGFPVSGDFKRRRRTAYTYLDTPSYIDKSLYHLTTDVTVWDAKLTNDNADDTPVARTAFEYDSPDPGWEMQRYGFTNGCSPPDCAPPPGYDTGFVDDVVRGLVTKVRHWSDATSPTANISFRHQFDLFGNELKAEVSCCSLKTFAFNPGVAGMHYSVPISIVDGAVGGPNLVNSFAYDFNTGFLDFRTDPNNLVTSYAPDAALRLRTTTYPKLPNDPNPNPTLETFFADANYPNKDGLVYQTKLSYFDGNTIKVQIGNQWLDGVGQLLRVGSASGPLPTNFDAVKSTYDDRGRVRKTTTPYNTTDPNGETAGLPNPTIFDYDEQSRVINVTLPDGNTVTTTYNGPITTVTDQVGRQKRSEVDGLGRVVKVTEMDGAKLLSWDTVIGYDLNNNPTTIDQGGQIRAFKYDSLSRLTFERTPEQLSTIDDSTGALWSAKYTYKDFGAIATREDARRVRTTFNYDALNRLSTIAYDVSSTAPPVVATPGVTIAYGTTAPALGQIKTITDGPGSETFGYDALSRRQSKTRIISGRSYITSYELNQIGQPKSMIYPSLRRMDMTYDSSGRLKTLGGTRNYINSVSYTPSQQVQAIQLANGLTESFGYSAERLQLTSQSVQQGQNPPLMNISYNYNADLTSGGGTKAGNSGQLISMMASVATSTSENVNRDQSFQYDQVGRLTYASGRQESGPWQRRYTYDRWGNRKKVETFSSSLGWCNKQIVDFKYSAGGFPLTNKATSVEEYSNCNLALSLPPAYDAAGNNTSFGAFNGVTTHLYDAESRVVEVHNTGTQIVGQYTYDAANRRAKSITASGTVHYVWEGNQVIAEHDGATGAVLTEYVYAGGRMLAQETNGTVTYYHQDRLSARLLTNGAGNIVALMSHEPFGEKLKEKSEVNKWRFTSYERDAESGTDYAVNRHYGTSTGRFLQTDPIAGDPTSPQSLNRYVYTANDPINAADPMGLYLSGLECQTFVSGTLYLDGTRPILFIPTSYTTVCYSSHAGFRIDARNRGGRQTRRVSNNPKTDDQRLRECYKDAIDSYDEAGNTSAQRNINKIEELSPLSLRSVADGIDEAAKVLKGGPGFVTRSGLQGPIASGSAGSAMKEGAKKVIGGRLGAGSLGLALGGLLTQALDPFIGRDKFLRDAVDECNSAYPNASKRVESSIFGTSDKVRDFLGRG